jgi:hypothetical protein
MGLDASFSAPLVAAQKLVLCASILAIAASCSFLIDTMLADSATARSRSPDVSKIWKWSPRSSFSTMT